MKYLYVITAAALLFVAWVYVSNAKSAIHEIAALVSICGALIAMNCCHSAE